MSTNRSSDGNQAGNGIAYGDDPAPEFTVNCRSRFKGGAAAFEANPILELPLCGGEPLSVANARQHPGKTAFRFFGAVPLVLS